MSGGAVNLTNLDVNGMGFGMNSTCLVGIFYEESSGRINQVITSSQTGADTDATLVSGFGMFIQGGSSKPSVTVENSSIHDFNAGGIYAVGFSKAPDLTVTIENNNISTSQSNTFTIVTVEQGTDATVSGNVVNGGLIGINIDAPAGSITGNTVLGSGTGISLGADGPSVKSNKIFNTIYYGIDVGPSLKASVIQGNTIMTVIQPGSLDVTGTGMSSTATR